jgi:hypothetical protein
VISASHHANACWWWTKLARYLSCVPCMQADLNQAISMVSYYASSSEPAQVRGKTVYLQYSNRQEIVTSKNSGDVASNVLLVTIEGVEAGDVSIDVLHLVSFQIVVTHSNGSHSCRGTGIIKGSERWCCKWCNFTYSVTRDPFEFLGLQANMSWDPQGFSWLDYVKFQLYFIGFLWTHGLNLTESYMD